MSDISKSVQQLIHINSVPPHRESTTGIATKEALAIMVEENATELRGKWESLLPACSGNPIAAKKGVPSIYFLCSDLPMAPYLGGESYSYCT